MAQRAEISLLKYLLTATGMREEYRVLPVELSHLRFRPISEQFCAEYGSSVRLGVLDMIDGDHMNTGFCELNVGWKSLSNKY